MSKLLKVGDWVDVAVGDSYEYGYVVEFMAHTSGKNIRIHIPKLNRYIYETLSEVDIVNNEREVHEGHIDSLIDLALATGDRELFDKYVALKQEIDQLGPVYYNDEEVEVLDK